MSEVHTRLRDYMKAWYSGFRRPDRFHHSTPGLDNYKKCWEMAYTCVKIVSDLKDLYGEDDECFLSWLDALGDALEQLKPVWRQTVINEWKWRRAFRRKYAKFIEIL